MFSLRPNDHPVWPLFLLMVAAIVWAALPEVSLLGSSGISLEEEIPSIQEIQQVAIGYAQVTPDKIVRWRSQARLRSLLPRLTVGVNRDLDRTVASSSSNGKTTFTIGPEDESLGVDVNLTWELGDLIFNSQQLSIDARSRLSVQLRNDVLEEVTSLYFSRQRLLAEFAATPTQDPVLSQERRLRIQELNARLDAYTGGFLSSRRELAKKRIDRREDPP